MHFPAKKTTFCTRGRTGQKRHVREIGAASSTSRACSDRGGSGRGSCLQQWQGWRHGFRNLRYILQSKSLLHPLCAHTTMIPWHLYRMPSRATPRPRRCILQVQDLSLLQRSLRPRCALAVTAAQRQWPMQFGAVAAHCPPHHCSLLPSKQDTNNVIRPPHLLTSSPPHLRSQRARRRPSKVQVHAPLG